MSLIYNLLGLKISGLISTYFILNGLNYTSYENELYLMGYISKFILLTNVGLKSILLNGSKIILT